MEMEQSRQRGKAYPWSKAMTPKTTMQPPATQDHILIIALPFASEPTV